MLLLLLRLIDKKSQKENFVGGNCLLNYVSFGRSFCCCVYKPTLGTNHTIIPRLVFGPLSVRSERAKALVERKFSEQ